MNMLGAYILDSELHRASQSLAITAEHLRLAVGIMTNLSDSLTATRSLPKSTGYCDISSECSSSHAIATTMQESSPVNMYHL